MTPIESLDERLARLARQTREIRGQRGFSERAMRAVRAEAALGLGPGLARGARRFLPLALVLAAAAVFFAIERDQAATRALAISYGTMELEW
jgi:hypothetical protein